MSSQSFVQYDNALTILYQNNKEINILRYNGPLLAALLLLCLAPMPYGYYQFIRLASMIAFAIMAYQYYEQKREGLMITFGALALLFQPFIKIALGRTMWNVVDVVVAVGLIVLWWKDGEDQKPKE